MAMSREKSEHPTEMPLAARPESLASAAPTAETARKSEAFPEDDSQSTRQQRKDLFCSRSDSYTSSRFSLTVLDPNLVFTY